MCKQFRADRVSAHPLAASSDGILVLFSLPLPSKSGATSADVAASAVYGTELRREEPS